MNTTIQRPNLNIELEKIYDRKTRGLKAWIFQVSGLHDDEKKGNPYPYCLDGTWIKKKQDRKNSSIFILEYKGFYRIGGNSEKHGVYYGDLIMYDGENLLRIDATEFINRLYMESSIDDILFEYSRLKDDNIVFLPNLDDT